MRAYAHTLKVSSDGKLDIPDWILGLLSAGQEIRLIVLVDEPQNAEDDDSWSKVVFDHFSQDSVDVDSVYDTL